MDEDNYYICHYGVKGMKWGVRKKRAVKRAVQKAKKATKKKVQEYADAKKVEFDAARKNRAEVKYYNKLRKKNVTKLTDKQIAELKARYEREASFYNSQKTAQTYNSGKSSVKKFLGDSVKQAAKPAVVKAGTYTINRIIKDSAGIKEPINWSKFADFVAPVGNKKEDKKEDKKDSN